MQTAYRHGEMQEPDRRFHLKARTLALAGIALVLICCAIGAWWLVKNNSIRPLGNHQDSYAAGIQPWQQQPLPLQEKESAQDGLPEPAGEMKSPEAGDDDTERKDTERTDTESRETESRGTGGGEGGGAATGEMEPGAVAEQEVAVMVHIAGAVKNPGVVLLSEPARVIDTVEAAGGLLANADGARINLAAFVADGDYIYVPLKGEELPSDLPLSSPPRAAGTEQGGTSPASESDAHGKVNLNSATEVEFQQLSGVGPVMAQRIVTWRDEHGPFTEISQLLSISGIGPAKYNQLKDQVEL